MRFFSGTLLLLTLLTACNGKKAADEAILKEAGAIHRQASEMQEALEPQMDSLAALKTNLAALKDPAAAAAVADIDSVVARFETWEETLVEVPGQEHEHHEPEAKGEAHHHHHDHKPAPNVTPGEMLDIQKELKTNIEQITADVKAATEKGKAVLKK